MPVELRSGFRQQRALAGVPDMKRDVGQWQPGRDNRSSARFSGRSVIRRCGAAARLITQNSEELAISSTGEATLPDSPLAHPRTNASEIILTSARAGCRLSAFGSGLRIRVLADEDGRQLQG